MAKENENEIDNELTDYEDDEDVQENQFLSFIIGQETYAIDLLNVTEILQFMPITPIPQTFEFIKGIINLRGKIIPVMDMRLRFLIEPKAYEERTCIIVVNKNNVSMGLIVDQVSEVLEIPDADIDTLNNKSQQSKASQNFVKGIGKKEDGVKIILNLDEVISFENAKEESKLAA